MKFLAGLILLLPLVTIAKNEGQLTTTLDHDKVVGCYWGTWAFYRPGHGKFDIKDIDPSICTHGYYGFADLDNVTWTLKPYDPWFDLAPGDCEDYGPQGGAAYCKYDSFRRFVALKDQHPNFKPLLSIGGWSAGSEKFSIMAADANKRQTFVDSILEMAVKFNFDGIDFDWEYPGSREGANPEVDAENYAIFISMLGERLKEKGLLLTAAVSPNIKTIDVAYNMTALNKHLDLINVMGYDYHGWWTDHNFTGHNSPLYGRKEEETEGHPGWKFTIYDSIKYYMEKGIPKEKLVLGMATYGRGFMLTDWQVPNSQKGLYCPADAGLPAGPYTKQDGIWGYLEVLQAFNNETLINLPLAAKDNWTIVVDDCYLAPYAVNGPYWIGYDDKESIAKKAQFINHLDLAGGFIWSLETDDFPGLFYQDKYPLLRTINNQFVLGTKFDPEASNCKGTAPSCADTDVDPPLRCNELNEVLPMPGSCHSYYICLDEDQDGLLEAQVFDCGKFFFDPNIAACVDPDLPGKEYLC